MPILLLCGAMMEAGCSEAPRDDDAVRPLAPLAPLDTLSTPLCTGAATPPPASGASDCRPPTPRRVWLLSSREYQNVVADLLGERLPLDGILPESPRVNGFDNQSEFLALSGEQFDAYWEAAARVASALPAQRFPPCDPATSDELTCATAFVAQFARRAFGRPTTPTERSRLVDTLQTGLRETDYAGAVRLAVRTVLSMPGFLYRTELGCSASPPPDAPLRLNNDELASALSFFVTGRRPDEALLRAAAKHSLTHANTRAEHARRLLDTPEARAHVRVILSSWLQLHELATASKRGAYAEVFTQDVRTAMQDEASRFIDDVLWQGTGTLRELLTRSASVVPAPLQAIYGDDLRGVPASDQAVELDPAHRKGVLSLPAFLTVLAAPDHSSPINRGVFVRERLLCTDIPAPPSNLMVQTPDDSDGAPMTTREKYALHSTDSKCRGCHKLIDPLGFGLEEMDAIGRRRTTEAGLPIDSSGMLDQAGEPKAFWGPAELGELLAGSDVVNTCFVTQLYRFAYGKPDDKDDACAIEALVETLRSASGPEGATIQDAIVAIVQSEDFALRWPPSDEDQP